MTKNRHERIKEFLAQGENVDVTITKAIELEHKVLDLGFLGRFFGSKEVAPIYVSGIVVFFGLVAVLIIALFDSSVRADALKAIVAAMMAALGFLGGFLAKK